MLPLGSTRRTSPTASSSGTDSIFAGAEADHAAEFSARHEFHGLHAESRGQNSVERAGRTSALNVAEHGGAHILIQRFAESRRRSECPLCRGEAWEKVCRTDRLAGSLTPSATTTIENFFPVAARSRSLRANRFYRERNFRDQDHVGAAGDSGMQRDPAGVAAHHFDDHHAAMRFARGVQAVDGVGGHMQRRIETERDFGSGEIVVDRLRARPRPGCPDGPDRAPSFACRRRQLRSARRSPNCPCSSGRSGNHFGLPCCSARRSGETGLPCSGTKNRAATRQDPRDPARPSAEWFVPARSARRSRRGCRRPANRVPEWRRGPLRESRGSGPGSLRPHWRFRFLVSVRGHASSVMR